MDSSQTSSEEVLRGIVARVTFRAEDKGYTVLQLGLEDARNQVTVVGSCLNYSVGTSLIIRGSYREHPRFGNQFVAHGAQEVAPSTPEGIVRYLGSGRVKGVGEKTAQRLVDKFGTQTLEVLLREPEKVAKVSGVGKHKAALLSATLADQHVHAEMERFFLEHELSRHTINRILAKYGNQAAEVVSRNPYLLASDVRGIGFKTADSIAIKLGFSADSPQRLKAGLFHALEKGAEDGHCFLPREQLIERATMLLGLEQSVDLDPFIEKLWQEDLIVVEDNAVYLSELHQAEEFVSSFIVQRVADPQKSGVSRHVVDASLRKASEELGISFSPEQERAVLLATQERLLVITGGPGCGKTTIIRAIVSTFREAGKEIALAAPTGKAAQRMAQVCGIDAKTIHRLLKFDPMSGTFRHGINEPLYIGDNPDKLVDVVIIDESSMIDLPLARDLFSAIPEKAVIILVGDRDQLPSVGPGRIFSDILSVPEVSTVALQRLFRRSEESHITSIAHAVNAGLSPEIPSPDGKTKSDSYFIERRSPEEIVRLVETLVADQIPNKFGIKPSDVTVLSPTRRGPLGTQELNQRLQQRLNSNALDIDTLTVGDSEFRVGDRVCQRVNNYQLRGINHPEAGGVFNGDTGIVHSIDQDKGTLTVEFWDGRLVTYERRVQYQLGLAYALTVHRSQGSELRCVVMVLHDSQYILLERQLLYTGITRAKELLIIVGTKRALAIAAKRVSTKRRQTLLRERIVASLR